MFLVGLRCFVSWQENLAHDKASGPVASQDQALLPGQQLYYLGGCLLKTDQATCLAMQVVLEKDRLCPVVCLFATRLSSIQKSVTF